MMLPFNTEGLLDTPLGPALLRSRRALWRFQFLHPRLRQRLYRRLAANLKANIPIYETFRILAARYETRKDQRAGLYRQWADDMTGATLADAFRGWIPPTEHATIGAADRAGAAAQGLADVADYIDQMLSIKKALRSAFSYPFVLVIVLAVYTLVWAHYIVPEMQLDRAQLSPESLRVLDFADALAVWTPVGVPTVLGLAALIWWSLGRYVGPGRDLLDRAVPWKVYKQYQSANFLVSVHTLLRAEIPLRDCLAHLREGASPWLHHRIDALADALVGHDPTTALAEIVDDELGDDIAIASLAGTIDATLATAATEIHVTTTERLQATATRANAVALAIIALYMILLVGSLFSFGVDLSTAVS